MTIDPVAPVRQLSRLPIYWQVSGALHAGEPSQSIDLDSVRFRIGRRPGLNLTLPSLQVSGVHAELIQVGGRLFVRDLNSTNGTYLNGRRLNHHDAPLRDGDRIRVGNIELRINRRWIDQAASDTGVFNGDTAQTFELPPKAPQPVPAETNSMKTCEGRR